MRSVMRAMIDQRPTILSDGDAHDVLQPLDYFVWAIVGPSGPLIVDTGFDEAMAKMRRREMLNPVAEGLKAINIRPDQVEKRNR